MKKINKLIFFIILALITIDVYAACDTKELNELRSVAANIKTSYEVMEGTLDSSEYTPPDGITDEELENFEAKYTFFRIYITNLTPELYVTVYNDLTKKTETYNYDDSNNGTVTFDWDDIRGLVNYQITIYSSSKTSCADTKLHTTYFTTPRYNEYSNYAICDGAEDYYLCYEYLTVPDVQYDEFVEKVTEYKNRQITDSDSEKEEQDNNGFIEFIKEYKIIIISVIVIIVLAGGLTTAIIIKKRRREI